MIMHSAQNVDDNHIKYQVNGATSGDYYEYIRQTIDFIREGCRDSN